MFISLDMTLPLRDHYLLIPMGSKPHDATDREVLVVAGIVDAGQEILAKIVTNRITATNDNA